MRKVLLVIIIIFSFSTFSNMGIGEVNARIVEGDNGSGEGLGGVGNSPQKNIAQWKIAESFGGIRDNVEKEMGGVLKGKYDVFEKYAKQENIDVTFLIALSMHESANGNSSMAKVHNNIGGMKCGTFDSNGGQCFQGKNGKWRKYESVEDAIEDYVVNFVSRMARQDGVNTVLDLQKIYCPDGDGGCDVWVSGISKFLKQLGVKADFSQFNATMDSAVKEKAEYLEMEFVRQDNMIKGTGVDDRRVKGVGETGYFAKGFISGLIGNIMSLVQAVAVLVLGFTILFLVLCILANNGIYQANSLILKVSGGRIDIADKGLSDIIGKSFIVILILVILVSGLLPNIFALIYDTTNKLLGYLMDMRPVDR